MDQSCITSTTASFSRTATGLNRKALICLAVQHASSSWGYRAAEFAFPLYFVSIFPATLLPASIYGLVLLLCSLLLSPFVGAWIDATRQKRLRTVRTLIAAQKISVAISYSGFILLQSQGSAQLASSKRWGAFVALSAIGSVVVLSNTGVTVAVERDWVTNIASGQESKLILLNTILRRIDLLSKLLAPLFVSLLTSTLGDRFSAVTLLAVNCVALIFEWVWISVVYRTFKELHPTSHSEGDRSVRPRSGLAALPDRLRRPDPAHSLIDRTTAGVFLLQRRLRDFLHLPTLPTSIALALLYTTVLSFDSTFLTYLKQPHPAALSHDPATASSNGIINVVHSGNATAPTLVSYHDGFIAGMRGICVLCGLIGTFLMPALVRRLGLVRTGSWSLAQQAISLVPTVFSLWYGVGKPWNTALLFTGLAVSRIGLWSYDLTQLSLLQQQLYDHRNASFHFATQQSLVDLFDISHFVLTLVWHDPSQFKKPAAVSLGTVTMAWVIYVVAFARKQRGHLLHISAGWRRLKGNSISMASLTPTTPA